MPSKFHFFLQNNINWAIILQVCVHAAFGGAVEQCRSAQCRLLVQHGVAGLRLFNGHQHNGRTKRLSSVQYCGMAHHFNLDECVVAVVEEVAGLARVDARDAQQKLPRQAQRHGMNVFANNVTCGNY